MCCERALFWGLCGEREGVVFVAFVELRRVVVKVKARLGEVRGLAFHLVSCATCCFLRAIVKEVSHSHVESDVIL